MKNLQLSLKKKWFEMTKSGEKREDYREITPYWCSRLLLHNGKREKQQFWQQCYLGMYSEETFKEWFECEVIHGITATKFDFNIMTLGYPSSSDSDRILHLKHAGIEIRTGNPEWGAVPNKLYFVIKHGEIIK